MRPKRKRRRPKRKRRRLKRKSRRLKRRKRRTLPLKTTQMPPLKARTMLLSLSRRTQGRRVALGGGGLDGRTSEGRACRVGDPGRLGRRLLGESSCSAGLLKNFLFS